MTVIKAGGINQRVEDARAGLSGREVVTSAGPSGRAVSAISGICGHSVVVTAGSNARGYTFTLPPVGVATVSPYPMSEYLDYYWTTATLSSLANDTPVSSWIDVLGGKELAQSTLISQPLYKTANASIKFDGSNDYLWTGDADVTTIPDTVANPTVKAALVLVVSGSRGTAGQYTGGWGYSLNETPFLAVQESRITMGAPVRSSTQVQHRNTAGTLRSSGLAISSGMQTILVTQVGQQIKMWQDGIQIGQTLALGSGPYNFDRFAIGCLLRSGVTGPSVINIHAVGVVAGTKAEDLHNNPAPIFGAAFAEWGTLDWSPPLTQAPDFAGVKRIQIRPKDMLDRLALGDYIDSLQCTGDGIVGAFTATNTARPSLVDDGTGRVAALFDGTDDMPQISGLSVDLTSGYTFFFVRKNTGTMLNFQGLLHADAGAGGASSITEHYHALTGGSYFNRTTINRLGGPVTVMDYLGATLPVAGPHALQSLGQIWGTSTAGTYIDGTRTNTTGLLTPSTLITTIRIAGYNTTKYLGYLYDWIIYDRALTAPQIEEVRDYLRNEWNAGAPF